MGSAHWQRKAITALLPAGVALLLHAPALTLGWLSDDFLYAGWAEDGAGTLLRHLTIDSYPRMLRPLLVLPWLLVSRAGGALWFHALSVLVHAANAAVLALVLLRIRSPVLLAAALAAAFAAAPWWLEAVAWASGAFDLWATALALGACALLARSRAVGARTVALATLLYLAALLAKESVILLPLIAWLLFGERVRRAALAMAGAGAAYLALRLALLHGLGGYATGADSTLAATFHRDRLGLLVRLPEELAMPWKGGVPLAVATATTGLVLLVAGLAAWQGRHRPSAALRAVTAVALAAAPALPVLYLGVDHQGGRLLYFPGAVLALGLGGWLAPRGRPVALAVAALLPFWVAAHADAMDDWQAARRQVAVTLARMEAAQADLPRGATVEVEATDNCRGAYVFRNGLQAAAALRGLRRDLHWVPVAEGAPAAPAAVRVAVPRVPGCRELPPG